AGVCIDSDLHRVTLRVFQKTVAIGVLESELGQHLPGTRGIVRILHYIVGIPELVTGRDTRVDRDRPGREHRVGNAFTIYRIRDCLSELLIAEQVEFPLSGIWLPALGVATKILIKN